MTSTHDSLPSNEDNEPNKWSEPFLALQEQLTSRCSWVSPKPSVEQKKEESKDAAALLRDLVDHVDQGNISDLDNGILCIAIDHFVHVLCTELNSFGDDALEYWISHQSKYQALFSNHPVVAHVIHGLFKNILRSVDVERGSRVVIHAFFLLQCQDKHTPFDSIVNIFAQCRGEDMSIEEFAAWYPAHNAFHATSNHRERLKIIQAVLDAPKTAEKQLESVRGPCISISFVKSDMAEELVKEYTVTSSMLLKWLCRAYARDSNVPLKSIRFTYEGRSLFLSSAGKKTVAELGMKHLSVINVSIIDQTVTDTVKDQAVVSCKPKSKLKSSKTKKKKGDKKNGNNKKKSVSSNYYSLMSEEEKFRQLHSKALSNVFEEAEVKFYSIRQRLNAMNLECMKPKAKKTSTKQPTIPQSINNPLTSGLGGKAGKSHVYVQVGEESNLYKSSKPLSNRSNQCSSSRSSATNKAIVIDLHGLTKKAALDKLDKALPVWIDVAMKGSYPFLVLVKIVHGGGNQVLEETVASWIKQNRQVANAPKSMCV